MKNGQQNLPGKPGGEKETCVSLSLCMCVSLYTAIRDKVFCLVMVVWLILFLSPSLSAYTDRQRYVTEITRERDCV